MPKFLFVANVARDLYNFRIGLMRVLRKKGFEVVCIAPEDSFVEKFKDEGFRFIPLEYLRRESKGLFNNLLLIWELYKIYKEEKPDLIFHYTIKPNIFGNIASGIAGIRSISVVTGLGSFFVRKSVLQIVIKYLYKFSFIFTEKVFFLNTDDRDLFVKEGIIPSKKEVLVNGEGIDTDYFSPEFCKEYSKKRKDHLVFLLIARLLWDKGIEEFVESARKVKERYPEVEFWLLGPLDKANPTAIPSKAIKGWEEKGIIKYLGVVDDVRPLIYQSDVVTLPSYREGIPRSLLEAISMGKPIITTDAPGCREVVEDGKNGFLVPVKDVEALTNAMIKFIELTEEERQEMGHYSREKAIREFDEKIIVKKYIEVIEEVLNIKF
jgi:glycosyltransferase involved in cell wall biosynthesis